MRLFLAITLADALRSQLAIRALDLTMDLNSPMRAWSATGANSLHLTLKFLGETQKTAAELKQALQPAIEAMPAFPMVVQGLGAFPTPVHASVLWAGVTEGKPQLAQLAARMSQTCTELGFAPESRPFAAHITLARTRHHLRFASAVRVLNSESPELFGEMIVREVTLYQSELNRSGAKHTALWTVPLLSAS